MLEENNKISIVIKKKHINNTVDHLLIIVPRNQINEDH